MKILRPLLLLIFISHPHKVKEYLDPIMLANDKIFLILIKM